MKKIFNIICFLLLGTLLAAQTKGHTDVIKLKQGHTVQGTIIKWEHDDYVIIKLNSGEEVLFPFSAIEKISQKDSQKEKEKSYNFKESGLYNATSMDGSLNGQGGYGLTHVVGWQFNRWIGVGLGSGYNFYKFNEERKIIPLFIEARSFLLKKYMSPYLMLRAGYGFALIDENTEMVDADGGFFFNPEVGYRFGARSDVNFLMGLGVKIQDASFAYDFPWSESSYRDYLQFERLVLKIGVSF